MCKTSTKVLNINFSESQTGVKGRKPRVSIHLTIRRERERAVTSSSPPPSFKDSAPPPADPCGQSSTRSAAAAPAGNNFHPVRKVDETLGEKKRYLADSVQKLVMLRRLLQGTNAAAHGGGDHSIQEERGCSRSTRPLQNRARIRALTHLLPSHAPALRLQRLSQTAAELTEAGARARFSTPPHVY